MKYKRKPIVLSPHAIALIQIFDRNDYLEDVWTTDFDEYTTKEDMESAAKQFIEQLEEQWCEAFMEALRDEINKLLE